MGTSQHVKNWRKRTKDRIVEAFGNCCGLCGYNKCSAALDLHHLDPSVKEIGLSGARVSIISWKRIATELRKCVLLCANCHREHHFLNNELPKNIRRFDENYFDYKLTNKNISLCPVCAKMKPNENITCSRQCAAKRKNKIKWDVVDLHDLYVAQAIPAVKIAQQLGVSDVAVAKRLKKLGIKRLASSEATNKNIVESHLS